MKKIKSLEIGFIMSQSDQLIHKEDWVAFMSQPYWVEVKVEVDIKTEIDLRLKLG